MPAPGNTNTTVGGLLKRFYKDPDGLTMSTFTQRPYWAMIQKLPDTSPTEGSSFQFAIEYNDVQSRNTVFGSAQAQARNLSGYGPNVQAFTQTVAGPPNVGSLGVVQFSVPRTFNYSYINISTELQLSSKTKAGAFAEAIVKISQSALNVLANDQEISMFGGSTNSSLLTGNPISTCSTGFITQLGTGTNLTTGLVQLPSTYDSTRLSSGQELDLYWNNAGVITKRINATGSGLFIGQVNRTTGQFQNVNSAGANVSITSVFSDAAVGDYVCVTNDFNQGAATGIQANGKLLGFESWVPFGGPIADSSSNLFCGVNRNQYDVTRLAGNWIDGTGQLYNSTNPLYGTVMNIEDVLIAMGVAVNTNSDGDIDTYAMNFNNRRRLNNSNITRTTLPGGKAQTAIPSLGFKATQVETDNGSALVIPDRFVGSNRVYGLQMDTWSYIHLGEPVQVYSLDGKDMLREADLDALAMRVFSFGNMVCSKPVANCTANVAL